MPTTTINLTGQALSKTDDTNVTLTLGGTPATALLKAVSLTLGWTGTLADSRIASASTWNAKESALTFSTGLTRIVNTITIDSTVVTLAGAQALSNKTGLISQWTNDAGYGVGNALTSNPLSQFAATTSAQLAGVISDETGSGALVFGTSPTITTSLNLSFATASTLVYSDASKNLVSLANGAANTYLKNDGSGNLSWATVASGISIGDAIGNSPVTGSVLMAIGGVITQSISYRAQQATPFGTAFGFASMSGNTGVNNTAFGYNAGLGQTTGTDNIYLGWNAGFRNITGNRNIYLGGIASDVSATNQSDNIFIGVGAGLHASGSQNIVVGAGDNTGSGLSTGNTVVGYRAMYNSSGSPTYNVALGYFAGFSASGHGSVYLGALAGFASTYTRAIGIGNQAQPSQNNEMMIGGVDSWFGGTGATVGITNVCIGNGNTYSTPSSVTLRITSASGSNIAGSTFTLAGSKATGTGAGGDIKHQTSVKGSSGTTLQTSGDRVAVIGKYVDLTAATATAFCRVNIPTSTTAGGFVIATVEANDGTDFQARTFYISWAAANKAGTTTVGLDVPHEIVAATSGTLTGTMTLVDSGSGNIDFKMDASSSLAETTLRISFQVFKNFGTGAISSI